jgi:Polyketide cyclase / dehydrase and lipid transport
MIRRFVLAAIAAAGAYRLVATGAVTIDVGLGRSIRPLGPVTWQIAASPEVVFGVVADPYLGRTPQALRDKLDVWERGSDMALAAHFTPTCVGRATTVETVRFDAPSRIDFRVLRGPVPHVVESFVLRPIESGTELTWAGELGTDLWALGRLWGNKVAAAWEAAVRKSMEAVRLEAERRA